MIDIDGYTVSITRGDTAYIKFNLTNSAGQPITLESGDVVKCQVRDKKIGGRLLFDGVIERDNNEIVWHIRPQDTKDLQALTYFWDAEVRYVGGDIFSFVPVSKFIVWPEITMGDGEL